jgi:hypothetical protein
MAQKQVLVTRRSTPATSGGGRHRTILIKNTAVGNDIADHVTVYGGGGTCTLVQGVLRKVITSDLTLRVKLYSSTGTLLGTVGTFTIPSSTAINTVVTYTSFTTATFPDNAVFVWDITASDGSQDKAGVASFTVFWE